MRILLPALAAALAAAACCTEAPTAAGGSTPAVTQEPTKKLEQAPPWKGPPVRAQFDADGAVAIVMTAPTASHGLELADVVVTGDTATVRVLHVSPGNTPVAQVVTDVTLEVPAARIPQAVRTVHVEVTTRRRDDPTQAPTPSARAATATRS